MSLIEEIREGVIEGQANVVLEKVRQALEAGESAEVILNQGLISGMQRVGELFEEGTVFVPEMLIAARAMDKALTVLRPHLVEAGVQPIAKVAIGTVKGDLHDIGKKLVAMMLEGSGFEIMDLGINVPPEKFVDAVRQGAQVVALSALLTTTMPNMKDVVDAIDQAGLRRQTRVIIGGAPVNQNYADQIGADGFAPDASSAVRKVRELVGV
ncbi:MAG: corrinoid protein [Anaerolineae bacterium]|nr:corrinoid protein [Anaerolineae bacterium]NUQ03073.1 corrinoid protein [Anaerolineae bacterium]